MGKGPYKVQVHIDTSNVGCIGAKHNYLTIIEPHHIIDGEKKITCRCDCGNVVQVTPFNWKSGRTKSCGCKTTELLSKAFTRLEHTEELDRLRRIYRGMLDRCYNQNIDHYDIYGARGITVCDEWRNDREAFIRWALSHGYANDLSIDRIDVNGNYEPSNCRWADATTQRLNQRPRTKPYKKRVVFTINGITKPAADWCAEYGISMQSVMYRVKKKSMNPFEALTTKKMADGRPKKAV